MQLLLLCGCLVLPGYGALVGPKEVSGFEGDTVSLQCSYGEELRTFRKYWCRIVGFFISRCSDTVYAGGDSQEGRVSVRDRRKELRFTVTLRNLTLQDAGKYWCGVQRLGLDESFPVSLLVFPGPCCPPSPSPSFQPLTTTRLQPKAKAWQTQPPELRIAYPATQLHSTSTKGPGPRSSSSSSSRPRWTASHHHSLGPEGRLDSSPRGPSAGPLSSQPPAPQEAAALMPRNAGPPSVSIPIARILAPVLILLALLLATALAALGSHVLCRRKEVPLAKETERSEKVDFAHSPPGNSWVPEYAVINLAGTSGPPLSPQPSASAYKDIQLLSQTSVEEEVPQDPEGDRIPVPTAPGSGEEPGLPKLTSV